MYAALFRSFTEIVAVYWNCQLSLLQIVMFRSQFYIPDQGGDGNLSKKMLDQ